MPACFTSRLLNRLSQLPVIGIIPLLAYHIQLWLWKRKPGLVERVSDFLLVGGASTIIQGALLLWLHWEGLETFWATIIAVEASAAFNFTANRFLTWADRFKGLTHRQSVVWFLPLFIVFNLTTPTVWLKILGISSMHYVLGTPVLISWVIFEGIGAVANFIGAEKISFGAMTNLLRRLTRNTTKPAYQTP